jgi:hypothetical protein
MPTKEVYLEHYIKEDLNSTNVKAVDNVNGSLNEESNEITFPLGYLPNASVESSSLVDVVYLDKYAVRYGTEIVEREDDEVKGYSIIKVLILSLFLGIAAGITHKILTSPSNVQIKNPVIYSTTPKEFDYCSKFNGECE